MAVGVAEYRASIAHNVAGLSPSAEDQRRPKYIPSQTPSQPSEYRVHSPKMDTPQSGYPSGFDMAGHQAPPPMGGDPGWRLHRSFSTPDVAAPGVSTDPLQAGPGGERKKNKLGYHRTSVACSHCRRRKIRCIPSNSDTQGRCDNCIRLKKECSFIPTEQQQQTSDSRPLGGAKARTESRDPSESSSPGLGGSSIASKASPQYPPLMTESTSMSASSLSRHPGSDGPISPMSNQSQSYDAGQNVSGWMPNVPQYVDPTTATGWSNPWRGRPLESSIDEHHPEPPLSATWAPPITEATSRDMGWGQMPTPRSFSYSGESLSGPNGAHFMHMTQGGVAGRQPFVAPSMSMSNMSSAYQPGIGAEGQISPSEIANIQWQQQQNLLRSQAYPWSQGQAVSGPPTSLNGLGDEASRASMGRNT